MSRSSRRRRAENRRERESLARTQEIVRRLSTLRGEEKAAASEQIHAALKTLLGDDPDYYLTRASWQGMADLPGFDGRPPRGAKVGSDISHPAMVLLTAGFVRCTAHHCGHLPGPDRSLMAFLGPRVASCKECLPRFFGALKDYDRRVAEGKDSVVSQCDFCLARGVRGFTSHHLAYQGVIYVGDACGRCAEIFC